MKGVSLELYFIIFIHMTRRSIALTLVLGCLPVDGERQVKQVRDTEKGSKAKGSKASPANLPEAVDSKSTEAETSQEVEQPQVPKHHANAENSGKINGRPPLMEADGKWVWVPHATAMEGPPEGNWDGTDNMGETMDEIDAKGAAKSVAPEDALSLGACRLS